MLKTVSSVINAIGALNYKGTWDAATNTPTITSSVGTKGDYYVVSVDGTTLINGISNWGVGDWIVFNGAVWQRVEGGADVNAVDLSVSGTTTLSGLTASTALALDANKDVISVTNTGTGDNVLATSPTLITPALGAATATSINKVALTAPATGSTLTIADGKTLTANQSLTLAGTDATTMTFPTTSATIARTDAGQTFTGVQEMTRPRFITSIDDTNGNELIGITATGSAVNEITVANAATTASPTISATGNDTNIGIRLAPKGTGDVTVVTGNLVVGTSGKGIDFSATPGTGTSELLDDYEEGTWTPTYVPQTNSFTSITYNAATGGKYVKIGKVVHIQAILQTDAITVGSASGAIRIGGLPFTVSASTSPTANGWSALSIGAVLSWLGERPSSGLARANEAVLSLNYRTAVDGDTVTSNVTDLDTGANKNILYVAGTYVTA
jgi:hypothetical protein